MPNANQEAIGDYLYFFRSPAAACEHCLIFGHAGWVPRLGDKFTVPAGVSLDFKAWHGFPNTSNPTREILNNSYQTSGHDSAFHRAPAKAQSLLAGKDEQRRFAPGEECFNYIVIKGVGKHWDKKNPKDSSYSELARLVGTAAGTSPVHLVSVRNRQFHGAKKYLLLSDVIDAVLQHEPKIKTIMMAGCRGIHPDWNP